MGADRSTTTGRGTSFRWLYKVYDGDTITIASKVPGLLDSPIYKFSVRLNGIDTPEIKGRNEEEKSIAVKARDALSGLIMGKDILLKNL